MRASDALSPSQLWQHDYTSQLEGIVFHETAAAAVALFIGPLVGHIFKSSLEWGANTSFICLAATLHKSHTIQGAAVIGGFAAGSIAGAVKGTYDILDSASSLLHRCSRIR